MQAAARRLLPTARQQLARPHRLGLRPNIHLRLRTPPTLFFSTDRPPCKPDDHLDQSNPIDHGRVPSSAQPATPAGPSNPQETEPVEEAASPETEPQDIEPSVTPQEVAEEQSTTALGGGDGGDGVDRPTRTRGRPTGSKSRRIIAKAREIPSKPVIPDWFLERGVILREENQSPTRKKYLELLSTPVPKPDDIEVRSDELGHAAVARPPGGKRTRNTLTATVQSDISDGDATPSTPEASQKDDPVGVDMLTSEVQSSNQPEDSAATSESKIGQWSGYTIAPDTVQVKRRYQLHEAVWEELKAHVRTGFALPKASFADNITSIKSHCVLRFPREGGVYFLDALAEKLAADLDADLIRIDAQDLEEIAGDYLGDNAASDQPSFNMRSLGYATQSKSMFNSSMQAQEEQEERQDENEQDDYAEEEIEESQNQPSLIPIAPGGMLGQLLHSATFIPAGPRNDGRDRKNIALRRLNEKKLENLLNAMVSTAQTKRLAQSTEPLEEDASPTKTKDSGVQSSKQKTLLHIRDYRELAQTPPGKCILRILHDVIQSRRVEGERIVILGTSSAEESLYNFTKTGLLSQQHDPAFAVERTILVPPTSGEIEKAIIQNDKKARYREINIRHLQDFIRRRSGDVETGTISLNVPEGWHQNPNPSPDVELDIPGISEVVWHADRVHRVGTVALSMCTSNEITIADIIAAVEILERSDTIKLAWGAEERKALEPTTLQPKQKIPKDLNHYEKKIISGVIDAKSIHTGFSSVRAAPDTIEAMKTLTSMSLIRPDAFKYGVLATDRIPGVLLYGPPGTGKTLLAKAVAKESGATVLEVAGSEIFDMYVGEGEKNVKAIFSLAKKLSPCVIFIDEADAIFGSRQSRSTRVSHREVINQFLKEWADLSTTAFMMVATNRPFDLDDAVLRRLPRRILIDLPTRDDRLEILKIHLASEVLSPSLDLEAIADRTPLYSGSDLKNICVSAALACVREENAEYERTGVYPAKRILHQRHFDKALNEVAASISDDMSSLTAIRKFDEKYGEGKGRKKPRSLGFGMGPVQEVSEDAGRVRT